MANGDKQYDNNMTGVLFRNEDKQTENHPDYKGQAEVNRVEFWLSAWVKTSQAGKKFLRLSFQPKQQQSGGGSGGGTQMVTPDAGGFPVPAEDDIPF